MTEKLTPLRERLARQQRRRYSRMPTPEELDIALDYAVGRVMGPAIAKEMQVRNGATWAAQVLLRAARHGLLVKNTHGNSETNGG